MSLLDNKIVFLISVIISIVLSVYLNCSWFDGLDSRAKPEPKFDKNYRQWLREKKVKILREQVSLDSIRYGPNGTSIRTERQLLRREISIACLVFGSQVKNVRAVEATWAVDCDSTYSSEYGVHRTVPVHKSVLHWPFFCERLMRLQNDTNDWFLITSEVSYVLLANLRLFLTRYKSNDNHYFGKTKLFWNLNFNELQAGIVLSAGLLKRLQYLIGNGDLCHKKFHNQNIDFILGEILRSMDVKPADTRDYNRLTTFHSSNINEIVQRKTPNCCSPYLISFNGQEASKLYTFYYLIEVLNVFTDGQYGNKPRELNYEYETSVWKNFLKEQRIENYANITAEEYFAIWVRYLENNAITDYPR